MGKSRLWGALVTVVVVGISLVGCVPERDTTMPVPSPTVSSSAVPGSGTDTPEDPTMLPQGSALANREYFDFVNNQLLAVNPNPAGQTIIDNLVAYGFDKAAMQVTPDKTSELRRPVDSIEFSAQIREDCLIGQFAAGTYQSLVGPALASGGCLIGKTRPIDW